MSRPLLQSLLVGQLAFPSPHISMSPFAVPAHLLHCPLLQQSLAQGIHLVLGPVDGQHAVPLAPNMVLNCRRHLRLIALWSTSPAYQLHHLA